MESPLICDLTSMNTAQRARHRDLAQQLRPTVIQFKELPDGFAAQLPDEPATMMRAAEFMTLERLCCPCLTLALEAEREQGPLWLKITGRDGAKPFIRSEFGMA